MNMRWRCLFKSLFCFLWKSPSLKPFSLYPSQKAAGTLVHLSSALGRRGFPGGSGSKESACNAGDLGSVPGLGRSPGEGNGNPPQYSCLKNSMDRGAWQATVQWGYTELDMTKQHSLSLHFLFEQESTKGELNVVFLSLLYNSSPNPLLMIRVSWPCQDSDSCFVCCSPGTGGVSDCEVTRGWL